jgi:valyl-tRNA synthetase
MILSTTYAAGQVPFKQVYLHGLVRAESGKKMSKSDPETMIDPLEIIPEYGTDALRLALVSGVNAGQDQRLGRSKIVDNRNFANKLWNIARYIEGAAGREVKPEPKTPADHWILNKLSILTSTQTKNLDNFRFSEAYQDLYHFIWDDLADWYVEASKAEPNAGVLNQVLESTLVLLHPFAPFITETIWQRLGHKDLLAAQPLPKVPKADAQQAKDFDDLIQIIKEIRRVSHVIGDKEVTLAHQGEQLIDANIRLLEKLGRVKRLSEGKPQAGIRLVNTGYDIWLETDKGSQYLVELKKRAGELHASMAKLEDRLANKDYAAKAPAELIEETKKQLSVEKELLTVSEKELSGLED